MSAVITSPVAKASGFIPEVWANKALDVLRANIVLMRAIARDADYTPQQQGDVINIPYPGTFTARKKTPGQDATTQAPQGGNKVPVTLSEHAYVDFIIDDVARVQASSELLDRWVNPAAIALVEQLESDLFTTYATFTGGQVAASGGVNAAAIREAGALLDTAKAPQTDRSLILSTNNKYRVLGDTELKEYFAFSKPDAISKGELGNVYNFKTYSSQLTPKIGTPVVEKNLAIHKTAMIVALRPLPEPEAGTGVESKVIVDDDSGLAIRVLRQYDVNARGHRIALDILYGSTKLRPELGVVING